MKKENKPTKINLPHIGIDKENNNVYIVWGKLEEEHCGSTESISLNGCQILVDRDKKGIVQAVEILW